MSELVRQGFNGSWQAVRTATIVGSAVGAQALQFAGGLLTGTLAIVAGHFVFDSDCRSLRDAD